MENKAKKKIRQKFMFKSIPDKAYYWAMVLPAIICVFMFNTRTWPGLLIAFEDYVTSKGWWGSEWVGLRNFQIFFMQPDCWNIIRNTLIIAIGKIVGVQCMAIVFALMLNEVRNMKLKKAIQTATYLPHFVSWVIFATIIESMLDSNGLVNNLLVGMGFEKISFLGEPKLFQPLAIISEMIKEFGWSAIIYLSAISGIDPGLYEAAQMDGANRWRQTLHITLPGLKRIIMMNAILSLGGILYAGFDQIFNLYNVSVMSTADILDTWVYRQGLIAMNYGVGTAVGLLNSVLALILTIISYWAAYKFADYKIF